jgi:ABC-type transporter Mla subunit MlaD
VLTSSGIDWPHLAFSVGAGLGVLLIGIGILVACSAFAGLLHRFNKTLDEVDRQISALSAPVAETLGHVGGIADTADSTVARLSAVVGSLESVAGGVAKTSDLASRAVAPAIVNVGATLTGVTAAVRRLVNGRDRGSEPPGE